LGEFTVRYAGNAASGRGHTIVVETAPSVPARGYITADGHPLDPYIAFGIKARMRQEMTSALRRFGGATQLAAPRTQGEAPPSGTKGKREAVSGSS
jgi:hypothetical protein